MGYACPVCGDPQADGEHLANHLAFTALRGDADHEQWLDDHAPDWDQGDAESLAPVVTEYAETVEFPQVFENTVDRRSTSSRTESGDTTEHDHEHDDERSGALFDDDPDLPGGSREAVDRERQQELDAQAERVLEDAREMTQQMLDDAQDTHEGTDGKTDSETAEGDSEQGSDAN